MTPNQRAIYLKWLSSGKKEPIDIGYVFVYFYGLERRALIDKTEIPLIIQEVTRLLCIYSSSNSFAGYATRFITFISADSLLNYSEGLNIPSLDASLRNGDNIGLSLALAGLYKNKRPLSADLAFLVAKSDIRSPRSVVVDRLHEHFKTLFVNKYNKLYGEGMNLKVASRESVIQYGPASPTLLRQRSTSGGIKPINIPDVLGIQSQFKPIVQIWAECIEELRPLNRELSKGTKAGTREEYRALPEELKVGIDHPDKEKWESAILKHSKGIGTSLLSISELAGFQGFEQRPKLTFKQSEDLAITANEIGFAVVPDARITLRAYGWDDIVAVIRTINKPTLPKSEAYHSASLMLELGFSIAAADGKIDNEEIEYVINTLESQFSLEPDDAHRLEAYREILLIQPPNLTGIIKRLEKLTKEQKEVIGKYIIGVSAADGVIHKKEISFIQKLYTGLGLDPEQVIPIIESIIETQPVEVQQGRSSKGEDIPTRLSQTQTPVVLNETLLRQIMADTAAVSEILGKALSDDEIVIGEEEKPEKQIPALINNNRIKPALSVNIPHEILSNLDHRYHPVLGELIVREKWLKEEMDSLARKYGLMPMNLLDTINTWSDEFLGDFLIEEGEPYTINIRILEVS